MVFGSTVSREEVSMSTIVFGVDLAKNVFSVCGQDGAGHVLCRQDFKRDAFSLWLAQVPVGSMVAMEACSGAHHWARRCLESGLQPRIMAAQFVTAFRKGRKTRKDRPDAEALATAARDGRQQVRPPREEPFQLDGRPNGVPADPRTPDSPMNERGLRVRFIHRSESALSTQQDRLRKCSLTIVAARKALTRSTHQTAQRHHQQWPESSGQRHSALEVDEESLTD